MSELQDQRVLWNEMEPENRVKPHSLTNSEFAKEVGGFINANSSILELGCSIGNDSVYFAEAGHRVTATDFSDAAINNNKVVYKDIEGLSFVEQDISEPFVFPDASFDVVYARLSLHYFDDETTKRAFGEINRVLKDGGELYFMCKSIEDNMYGEGEEIEKDMYQREGHIRHFFSEEYCEELLAKGFEIRSLNSGKKDLYGKMSGYVKVSAVKS